MSTFSLADFMKASSGRSGVVSTATVSGRGTRLMDASARSGDFYLATSEDIRVPTREDFSWPRTWDHREVSSESGRGASRRQKLVVEGRGEPSFIPLG
jgi:hypothetical protein